MESLTSCPPWLLSDGGALMARSSARRLPHALLITGIDGIGKRAFGQWLAESLLCRNANEDGACGVCDSCRQLLADSHPDYRKLIPEGANAAIKVDRVRDLVEWLQLTAGQGSYRVALLEDADSLNRNAANSLLKTLEEPGDHTVLILTATRIGSLPATIRSRCQKITLKMGDKSAAINWLGEHMADPESALMQSGGGPYVALRNVTEERLAAHALLLKAWLDLFQHKGSVGRIADSLSGLDTAECLAVLSSWCLASAKKQVDVPIGVNPAVEQAITETLEQLGNEQWFTLHNRLLQLHRSDSASFKTQTVLEGLFADIRLMING